MLASRFVIWRPTGPLLLTPGKSGADRHYHNYAVRVGQLAARFFSLQGANCNGGFNFKNVVHRISLRFDMSGKSPACCDHAGFVGPSGSSIPTSQRCVE